MTSNSDDIVQQVQQDFQILVAYVTGADARGQSAYTVEVTLCRRLLALGAALRYGRQDLSWARTVCR
jgi:hypothetical protein